MTSPVNPLTPPTTAANDLAPLVKQLARRADFNKDGQVSTAEFSEFLTGLLESISAEDSGAAPGVPSTPDAPRPAAPAIAPAMTRSTLTSTPKA